MLALVLGPTAVGKTTIMKTLQVGIGCGFITTFTTRKIRHDDNNKVTIDASQIDERDFVVQTAYGNSYAQKRVDLLAAKQSNSIHLLDISCKYIDQFAEFNPLAFLLLPDSQSEYASRLQLAGRADRLEEALKDYDFHLSMKTDSRLIPIIGGTILDNAAILQERLVNDIGG